MMKHAKIQFSGLLLLTACLMGNNLAFAQQRLATDLSQRAATQKQVPANPVQNQEKNLAAIPLFKSHAEADAFIRNNPSIKTIAPTHAKLYQDTSREIVVEEDFSLFTAGSETEPDSVMYPLDYENGNRYIDNSLTHTPGWVGSGVYQAGGICALAYPNQGGSLNTPMGDYSGDIIVTFRARAMSSQGTTFMFISAIADPMSAYPISLIGTDIPTIYLDTTWQEYTIALGTINYSNKDACVQFNGRTYNKGILIDDIQVTRGKNFVASPMAALASNFTLTSFQANWNKVRNANEYLLSLYREEPTGDDNISVEEDFDSFETGIDSLPEGWDGINAIVEDGQGVNRSQAVRIGTGGTLDMPDNGGRVISFSFSAKALPYEEDSTYSGGKISFEGYNGQEWSDLGMYIDCNRTEYGQVELIDAMTADLQEQYYRFRLRVDLGGWKAIFIDDISYQTTPSSQRIPILEDTPVTDTFFVYEDMDEISEYYYFVKAKNDYMTSPASNLVHAYGITAPEAKEATEVDPDGPYTANWNPVPRATAYSVYTYKRTTLEEDQENYNVVHEDFSKVNSEGTAFYPEYLGNYTEQWPLDEYMESGGWLGINIALAEGYLGFSGYGEILSPYLDLSGNDGKYTVTVKFIGSIPGESFVVQGTTQYHLVPVTGDEQSVTLEFSDGASNSLLYFYTQYGYADILIDEITVQQDLLAGDHVYTPETMSDNIGSDNLSYRFSDLVRDDKNVDYAYRVFACYNKFITDVAWSEASDAVVINYNSSDTTLPECPVPTNLRVEDITTNSARLLWDADAENTAFNLRFRQADASEWNNVSDLTENEYALTDLDDNTAYVWTVMAACSEGRYSGWATENEFTTQDVANESLDKAGLFVTTGENRINVMNPSALNIDRVRVYTLSGSLAHDFAIRSNGNVLLTTGLSMQVAVVEVLADGQVSRFKVMLP